MVGEALQLLRDCALEVEPDAPTYWYHAYMDSNDCPFAQGMEIMRLSRFAPCGSNLTFVCGADDECTDGPNLTMYGEYDANGLVTLDLSYNGVAWTCNTEDQTTTVSVRCTDEDGNVCRIEGTVYTPAS